MDDLNIAASSIMDLLAKLLSSNSAEKSIYIDRIVQRCRCISYSRFKLSFAQVLPKIFPFCRHHTIPFRLAAIETVMKIIEASQVMNNVDCRFVHNVGVRRYSSRN
jgi:hypothetical protein